MTGHLFGLDSASRLYEFDPITRDVLSVTDLEELIRYPSPVPGSRDPKDIVFSGDGSKLYITVENSTGDRPGTGKLVVLNRTVVPEPSSLALLTVGLGVAADGLRLNSRRWRYNFYLPRKLRDQAIELPR